MLSKFNKEEKVQQKEEKQYIVFFVNEKQFGVDVGQAREIINKQELTYIPNAPDFIQGVINLRGEIIPIIELKNRLNLSTGDHSREEKIIIVELDGTLLGMQVDDVKEMIRLNVEDIADPPEIVKGVNRNYLSGVGKLGDKLLILLNLDRVLSSKEIEELDELEVS